MINFSCVEPQLYIGSAPQSGTDVARLNQMKVDAVLSLQSDTDFKDHRIDLKKITAAYQSCQISFQRFPIMDFNKDDLTDKLLPPVKHLDWLLSQGQSVYVHCNAGISRAPSVVLGYLCYYRGMDISQGLHYLRENRPQVMPYKGAITKLLKDQNDDRAP